MLHTHPIYLFSMYCCIVYLITLYFNIGNGSALFICNKFAGPFNRLDSYKMRQKELQYLVELYKIMRRTLSFMILNEEILRIVCPGI